jgi:predicted transcriptional regulator
MHPRARIEPQSGAGRLPHDGRSEGIDLPQRPPHILEYHSHGAGYKKVTGIDRKGCPYPKSCNNFCVPHSKKLIESASDIVQTQVSLTPVSAADIAASLRQVFSTLHELQRAESGEIELPKIQESAPTQTLTPQESIQNDKIICLECGAEFKQLTHRHLLSHGLSPKEYRKKYVFTMRTPLLAKSVTKARSKAAKKRGLPEKLKKAIEAKRQEKAKTSAPKAAAAETVKAEKPKRTRLRKRKTV